MARGVNLIMLLGFVGEVVIRDGRDNKIANITLATNEEYKDKAGEQVKKTEWHKLVVFGPLADVADKYVKKGTQLHVEGSLFTEKYQDKEGRDIYTTKIKVKNFIMVGDKEDKHDDRRDDYRRDDRDDRRDDYRRDDRRDDRRDSRRDDRRDDRYEDRRG